MSSDPVDPGQQVAAHCLDLLRHAGATVATAESLTAGQISATLASVAGASDALRGGLTAYATDVKIAVLGVDAALVAAYGAVSTQCAEAMARQALELFHATWALSATGVAGPGEQEGKPAGTVFVGLAGPDGVRVRALSLAGSRNQIRAATVQAALTLLEAVLDASSQRTGQPGGSERPPLVLKGSSDSDRPTGGRSHPG